MIAELSSGWVVLTDHFTAIRYWRTSEHSMDFRVFDVVQVFGTEQWELSNGGVDYTPLGEWTQAFWTIEGNLKWDGCINWQTNPGCMAHGCGPNHADEVGDIFRTVYHVGKRYMDLLGDAAPAMPERAVELLRNDPTPS